MYQNKDKENNLIYYWTFWPQDSQLIAQNLEGIATLTYVYLKYNPAQRINIKEEKYLKDSRCDEDETHAIRALWISGVFSLINNT